MASSCIVPIVILENVRPHPNADKLDVVDVLGFQACIPKGSKTGDIRVYFPADTIIPDEWSEKLGVKNYLVGKDKNRVGKIRLRGEPSFGIVIPIPDELSSCNVGDNVSFFFQATKYEPPMKSTAGDSAKFDPRIDVFFERYTDIENGRIFMDVFEPGEEVIVTEKIHGTNCKIGIIDDTLVAGSMGVRRTPPIPDINMHSDFNSPSFLSSTYWFPWSIPEIRLMIGAIYRKHREVLVYGEVFGGSVQSLHYGISKGRGLGFRVFDIMLDGKYMIWEELYALCFCYGVSMVPILFQGPFDFDKIKELSDGSSAIYSSHIREGVVVKPIVERTHPKIGRVILKYIGSQYELSKQSDSKDV
ncbi:MAG: RNA ligase (ATP) [Candidatus Hodarchaeales archaeon]